LENNRKEIEHIDRYLAYCETRSVPAKTVVIETGEASDSLFYILEGTLTVSVTDESGRQMILAYLSEGEFFGGLGVYDDGQQQRSASVLTRTDCVIGQMDYQRFHELAKIYPSLMKALDSQVASRLRTTTKKVLDLAFLDVTGRVASCLLDLCKLPEAIEVEDGIQLKISRQEIARIVGCSREMAGRILKDMQDMGLIHAQGMTVVLLGATKETDSEE
jgi:CRP/FNR family transcriptional regulator, cyclic AMP receptor protein